METSRRVFKNKRLKRDLGSHPDVAQEEGCGELMVTLANQRASNFAIVRVDSGLRMAVVGDPPARAHQRGGSRVYNLISDGSRLNAVEAEVLLSEHPTCVTTW